MTTAEAQAPARTIAQLEQELVELIASCANDPVAFARVAFPWGEGELIDYPWTEDVCGLDDWQLKVLCDLRDGLTSIDGAMMAVQEAVASGHGVGKSALVAIIILWAISTEANTKGIVTANTEKQLVTKTWAELAKWKRMCICEHWFELTATALFAKDQRYSKTWRIDMVPWSEKNSEAFAGLHNKGRRVLLIFDEASAIPDIIWEVAEGALTDEDTQIIFCAFGNPTRARGRFRDCFSRFKQRWRTYHVDSRTARMTNKRQLQVWIDDYGIESDFVKVRVLGQFPSADINALFLEADVDAAMNRLPKKGSFEFMEKVLGVDVARQGGDDSVIAARHGKVIYPLKRMHIPDSQLVAQAVAAEQDAFGGNKGECDDATLVDATGGYGTGVVDALRTMNRSCIEVYFSGKAADPRYFNKRSEMFFLFAKWVKAGGCLPKDKFLREELLAVTYSFQGDKFRICEKDDIKEEIGRSPDAADACACTFAVPVAPGAAPHGSPIQQGQRQAGVLNDYDPFDPNRRM